MDKFTKFSQWQRNHIGENKKPIDWLIEDCADNEWQAQELRDLYARLLKQGKCGILAPDKIVVREYDGGEPSSDDARKYYQGAKPLISVWCDFKLNGIAYDLNTPTDIFKDYDPAHPELTARKYLEWKAEEVGIADTNFVEQAMMQPSYSKYYRPWYLLFKDDNERGMYFGPVRTSNKRNSSTSNFRKTEVIKDEDLDDEEIEDNNAEEEPGGSSSKSTKKALIGLLLIVFVLIMGAITILSIDDSKSDDSSEPVEIISSEIFSEDSENESDNIDEVTNDVEERMDAIKKRADAVKERAESLIKDD